MTTRSVTSKEQAERLAAYLVNLPVPFTVTVREGKVRSLDQNALLHRWYHEISAQRGDISASEAKGQCHHRYGLPIRLRDAQFAWLWKHSAARLDYEKRCAVLASGQFQISSKMTTKELTEYMRAMESDFVSRGFHLTKPVEE